MNLLQRADAFTARYFPVLIPLFVGVGVLFPDVFSPLGRYLAPLLFFMTFSSCLGAGFRDLLNAVRHPLPVLMTMVILHVILPLTALGLGTLLFPQAPLFTIGLVLEYSMPTAVASLTWANMTRGNIPMCLSLVLLDTLCAPVVVPWTLKLLVGSVVEMDAMSMMRDLMVMVAIPAAIAMLLYGASHGRVAHTVKPVLTPFSRLALLVIIMANATSCAPFLDHVTPVLVRVMFSTFCMSLMGFFLGYWTGRIMKLDFPSIQTLCLNAGMRNNSAGAVLARQYFPTDVLFPTAFSPLFFQMITAIIVRIVRATKLGRADQAAYEAAQRAEAAGEEQDLPPTEPLRA